MNVRGVAAKLAVVGILAGTGVAVAAAPASAYPNDCHAMHSASLRAAQYMANAGTIEQWNLAYDMWLRVEDYLNSYC